MSYPGTQEFLELLHQCSKDEHKTAVHKLLRWTEPITICRAPGRMDVMGGIADYSGSLVLQMPIKEACFAAVQVHRDQATDASIRVVSLHEDSTSHEHRDMCYSLTMNQLFPEGKAIDYAAACNMFKADARTTWAAYIVGCVLVLSREEGISFENCTVSILLSSSVPEGKGVSSSASVEVATMSALLAALGRPASIPGQRLATLCQMVENLVVGAPCGIMDQMSSALGEQDKLLALLCQPAEVQGCVTLPPHLAVWGIDSGVRHSVGGSDYGAVRVGAFMGLRIAQAAASTIAAGGDPVSGHKRPKHERNATEAGKIPCPEEVEHLVQISPSQYEEWLQHVLPEQLSGQEFLDKYGKHIDSVTSVNPTQQYAIKQPARHPIYEHHRVRLFQQLLQLPTSADNSTNQGLLLGELMFQSHASYSACELGSPGTDRLVQLVREHIIESHEQGRRPLLYGAKITGGGCGGTVCILGKNTAEADELVECIGSTYWSEQGQDGSPGIFRGSSGGAVCFGHLTVKIE